MPGDNLFELLRFAAQILRLTGASLWRPILDQPLLACLEELRRPALILTLRNAFAPAQFDNAVLAAQSSQHNPDLLFRLIALPRPATDTQSGYARLQ